MTDAGIDKIVDVGADISGNFVTSILAGAVIPGASLLGNIVGPVVSAVFKDIAHRHLSCFENDRLEIVWKQLIKKVQQRLDAGEQPRRDDDFYVRDEYLQSSASKLLEGMLLKCKQEFEAKKLIHYGDFWSNVCFENSVNYEEANSIITLFSSLSYQQIKLLVFLNRGDSISLSSWEKYMFCDSTLAKYYTVYADCLHLYNVRIAQACAIPRGVRIGTPDIRISPSGRLMCKLFDLELPESEFKEMSTYLNNINEIVNHLMEQAKDDGSDSVLSAISEEEIDTVFNEVFE